MSKLEPREYCSSVKNESCDENVTKMCTLVILSASDESEESEESDEMCRKCAENVTKMCRKCAENVTKMLG